MQNKNLISEQDFVSLIESMYINTDHERLLISKELIKHFPPIDGFCEITHYCFEKEYGKIGDEYETPQEFYQRLILLQ